MSGDFLISLLLFAIIGTILYQLVLKPIRNRRRIAAAKAERQRIVADARRAAEAERLRQQQENPSVVFGRLIPHKMEDEITRKLREKTPLRPILRSNEPSESRLRKEDRETGSTFYVGQPFIDDDLNRLQFAARNDGDCIDGRYSPHADTDRGTSNDDIPATNHATADTGWGGSHNDNGGGTTTDSSPASTGDSGGGSYSGD